MPRHAMGCLPIIFAFVLATGIGWWLGGVNGAIWGAGIGIAIGMVAGAALVLLMRRTHTDHRGDH